MRKLIVGPLKSLVALTAVATLMLGSSQGAGATTSLAVGDTGALLSKGVAVLVPVEYVCEPSFYGAPTITIKLAQRQGGEIVSGQGSATLTCDNSSRSVGVFVSAQGKPFKRGEALATTSAYLCGSSGCTEAGGTKLISIRKG